MVTLYNSLDSTASLSRHRKYEILTQPLSILEDYRSKSDFILLNGTVSLVAFEVHCPQKQELTSRNSIFSVHFKKNVISPQLGKELRFSIRTCDADLLGKFGGGERGEGRR